MLMLMKKYIPMVVVIAVLAICWIAMSVSSEAIPLTEIELSQLQTLMRDREAFDQALSLNGYTKGEGDAPTYYKMIGNGKHNLMINIKLDQQFWYTEDACYFGSDKSGAPGIDWGHTLIISCADVEIFMRELSSSKHASLIDEELQRLLTAMPNQ